MSNENWFRNKTWNDEIESHFMAKLKRARRKESYLRIQASVLADIEPNIAISLLGKYFELKDDFDHAQAYCDFAKAYLALGEHRKAIASYKSALERETEFPKLKTEAYILYPLTIIQYCIYDFYNLADEVLENNHDRLMFPVDYFRWHGAKAIIEAKAGNKINASAHAQKA